MQVHDASEPPTGWSDLAAADPSSTLFQHPLWLRALTRAYPALEPRFISASTETTLLGVLPYVIKRRLGLGQVLSLPFGTHGGPLVASGAPTTVIGALGEAFARRARSPLTIRAEMTVYRPSSQLRDALAPSLGDAFQEFQTHVIPLSGDFEELWAKRYRKNTRNCVRVSERAGVTIRVERGSDAVDTLARLHAHQATQWEGIVPHPRAALAAVVETYADDARIYVARQNGDPLCAILLLDHGGKETHAWVSGATDASRPVRAYHHMINECLRDANARGLGAFHFGGSGGQGKLEFFKESFAAEPMPVLRVFRVAGWFRKLRRGPVWD